MEEGDKVGTEGNTRRVRVERLPEYREMRRLLRVWLARPKTHITGLHSKLYGLRGTPQNRVDWKDPDTWIAKRVTGKDRELAHAIWTESGVNPRYTDVHWSLTQHYELLVGDADGKLQLTERGSDFIDHEFGKAEAFLDQQEGLIKLLTIVADAGSASRSALREPWAEYLGRHSRFQARTTIDFTLSSRLKNLVDRDLVKPEGSKYAIAQAGRDYLGRVGVTTGTSQDNARRVRVPWLPTYRDVRGLLGVWPGHSRTHITKLQSTILQLTGTTDDRVDWSDPDAWIPERLSGEHRKLAYAIWTGSDKTVNPRHTAGSWSLIRHYALLAEDSDGNLQLTDRGRNFIDQAFGNAETFLDQQEGLIDLLSIVDDRGPARLSVLLEPWAEFLVKRNSSFRSSSTIKDTLRRRLKNLLDRKLVNRQGLDYAITEAGLDYLKRVGTAGGAFEPPAMGGFASLTQSLREEGLLFSRELVANYLLALQTKRFAILTGISGTGKTKLAKAVAQCFEHIEQKRVAKNSEDAVGVEVKPSHVKRSKLVLPVAISADLSIGAGKGPGSGPDVRVRFPGGRIKLRTYVTAGQNLMVLFRGDFRKWFQSTFDVGDTFWLQVHPSEAADSDELEFGRSETEVVEQRIDNYVVIPVRPDWVDNRGLLGYLNPLTNEYSTTPFLNLLLRAHEEEKRAAAADEKPHPFFVILDEMNLARVEHYFSDFLSALESGEPIPLHEDETIESGESESGPQVPRQLTIPGNVLFTGTVNVDETTYMFSPKVLDRAFTIEFDQVDLEGFTKGESSDDASGLNLDGVTESLDLLRSGSSGGDDWKPSRDDWVKYSEETPGLQKALRRLHGILEAQHRHFGYRVANEIARFVNLAREQATDGETAVDAAFDLALLQKVLPKFHGTQQELESLLERIFHFAVHGGEYRPKQNEKVDLDDWKVDAGRLLARSKDQAQSGDDESEAVEPDSDDAEPQQNGTQSPAYPRTGAKVLRMLQRLRDRGFTSFIE